MTIPTPSEEGRCCSLACTGACEVCPCCSAGWCVMGYDGLPEDFEDFSTWLEVASDYNPVAGLLASYVHMETRRVEEWADRIQVGQVLHE